MTDKFRGRKLFVTNPGPEHSHYLILTTVTSISNHRSPFKEREVDGRQILWQKIFSQKLCKKLSKHQYILRYPFETTFNNIFNRCFHFHQRHIHTTSIHPTQSKRPKANSQFNTFQSTILSSNPNLTQSPPEP